MQKKRDEASKHTQGQRVSGRAKEAVRPKAFSSSNAGVSARAAKDEEQRQAEERTEEKARSVMLPNPQVLVYLLHFISFVGQEFYYSRSTL